jgi:ribosome-binding protein aMBF1 (putative translation factor)
MTKIIREDFSVFVKSMRITAGLDQETLALLLNVKPAAIRKYEDGKSLPEDPYAFEYDLRQVIKKEILSKKL